MSKINTKKSEKMESKPVVGIAYILSHKILFILHAFLYLAVSGLLLIIWAVTLPTVIVNVPQQAVQYVSSFWPIHAIMGWGIAIGFHAVCFLMYNDKIEYLSLVRRGPLFGILFVFHAWFYGIVNIYLIIINAMYSPEIPTFLWTLSLWGIGFGVHAFGFFTWAIISEKERKNLKEIYPDYSEKRLKLKVNLKLTQLWLLIAHIAYYIVLNILSYTSLISETFTWGFGGMREPIQGTIVWGILLGVHALSYFLFNYLPAIKPEIRTLLLNITAYGAFNIYFIILQLIFPNAWMQVEEPSRIWVHYPLILWGIFLIIHAIVTVKYDILIPKAIDKVKSPYTENLEDFELKNKAIILMFLQWTFISHAFIYVVGLILIGVDLAALGIENVLIHVAMGWLIALGLHGAIFIIILKQIYLRVFISLYLMYYICLNLRGVQLL
ncbi:MAG: 2TM domain-containing protein [Promethearchaeota archaeon]